MRGLQGVGGANVPTAWTWRLMRTEVLAQRWRLQAMALREQLFARLPDWLHAVRRWPGLRQLLGARQAGGWTPGCWSSALGIAAGRSLPALAPQSFAAHAAGAKAVAPPPRPTPRQRGEVVLLVDTFSNQFDPSTAQAAVEVLQAAGCTVHLAQPPAGEAPLCCGRTALSGGLVDQARAHAQRLIAALQPHVDAGRLVIGLEPSCLLMLRDEYHSLGLGEPAQRLAKQALLLEEFLARECDGRTACSASRYRWARSTSPARWCTALPSKSLWHHESHAQGAGLGAGAAGGVR